MSTNPTKMNNTGSAYALWALVAGAMILLLAYATYRIYEPRNYTEIHESEVIVEPQ